MKTISSWLSTKRERYTDRESKYSFFNLISVFCTTGPVLHVTNLKTYTPIFFPKTG